MPDWLLAILYFLFALILLRIGGKKTFSQMTPSEVIVMIGLGTVLVHPLKSENIWRTTYHGLLIVLLLLLVSIIQLYFPKSKRWIMGEPRLLIKDGKILHHNLKRSQVPIDELYMRLRLKKVNDIAKVKSATLEVSGQLGLELYPDQTPATKQELREITHAIQLICQQMGINYPTGFHSDTKKEDNLFEQIEKVQGKDPLP